MYKSDKINALRVIANEVCKSCVFAIEASYTKDILQHCVINKHKNMFQTSLLANVVSLLYFEDVFIQVKHDPV